MTEDAQDEVHVLLVDDDPDDRELTRQAFRRNPSPCVLHMVESGEDALRFMRRQAPFQTAHRPGLVLLDLNMVGMHGKEVLDRMKQDPDLRSIPVVVLTTSQNEADVADCYAGQAAAYVVKPVEFNAFVDVIRGIQNFWLRVANLPRRPDGDATWLAHKR